MYEGGGKRSFSLYSCLHKTDKAGTLDWSECEHQQHHSRWLLQ